ncbi:ATP-dependent zinc metalloprotease FtsH, partial [Clostridiaceae bacterium HSG29]|nr:ATP-dependent zinc metalloprotease FtsH [Clostridiaceae bacterium HSG29]
KFFKGATIYLIIFIAILFIVKFYGGNQTEIVKLDVTQLNEMLKANEIGYAKIDTENKVTGTLKNGSQFTSNIPGVIKDNMGDQIYELIDSGELKLEGEISIQNPWYLEMLPTVFLILILVGFWFVFMQNSQGGGSKVMKFGKSKARLNKQDEKNRITFADVAGLEEEKEEMAELVDFLRNPKKYIDLGARIPKGILMVGPPGTGKTYLTKAVAGEADVPFYSISGSDFVEMFVGVGASRVRDLFKEAKENSPCLVFIDEIDAVGRKRGAGLGGGHDEREQTLNQLLVEMDGFEENQGIILIAATNRPDILDPALLRAGRFDRQVMVGIPDVREREEILKVHSKKKPIGDDVDLKVVAQGTPGFTPADLENLLNEAALLSARRSDKKIRMETVEEAKIKVIAGVEKKSRVVSDKERKLTAYHEGGHALLAKLLPDTDPVHQVTIIPRGRAGGFTLQLPREDRSYQTKKSLETELVILLGGRVAEKIILGDVSTGASNDLSRVTKIARSMVVEYAMSDNLSSMSYSTGQEVFLGNDMTSKREYSEQVAADIDREIRGIVDNAFDSAYNLLESNQDKLHAIAKALLEYETLTGEEFDVLLNEGYDKLKEKIDSEKAKKDSERQENIKEAEEEKKKQEELLKENEEAELKEAESVIADNEFTFKDEE